MSKKNWAILLLVLLLLASWGFWRIYPYLPFIHKRVTLNSAVYLRLPYTGLQDSASYDPAQSLLVPEWIQLTIDRENSLALFESSAGERVRVPLGKPHWVKGCENHVRMEAFPLVGGLSLGSLTFQQPMLIVMCDVLLGGEKIRPVGVVLKEGPFPENDYFYSGVRCDPGEVSCLSFAEELGTLVGTVIDAETREALPSANILLTSGMGVQEFTGNFSLPVYASMQVSYQISLPGYADQVGKIFEYDGNKLDIMYYTNTDHTQGRGNTIDLQGYGQQVDYNFELAKK